MLELKDISLAYGQRILLEKISVVFDGGRLTAMLGRNGAGKSTLPGRLYTDHAAQTVLYSDDFEAFGKSGPVTDIVENVCGIVRRT